jgi:Bacterial Ig-like domain (group 2)
VSTRFNRPLAAAAGALLLCAGGCDFPAPGVNGAVFADAFSDLQPERFADSLGPISVDSTEHVQGFASMKVVVPDDGCAGSDTTHYCYAGWAMVANTARDLSGFDALTFWAKSSTPTATLTQVGFGNDNSGQSRYTASVSGLPITNAWTKYVIPIPVPARLTAEKGLLFFAAGNNAGSGFTFWLDDVKFEALGPSVIGAPQALLPGTTLTKKVGSEFSISAPAATFAVNGSSVLMSMMPAYFSWTSSDPTVAAISAGGVVSTLAYGTATINAKLGETAVGGAISVVVPGGSTTAAPFVLFDDNFTIGGFQAWANALGTMQVTTSTSHSGSASVQINVPSDGCPKSDGTHYCYAGGAVVADSPQDLTPYNALTFWAKASNANAKFAPFGIGNDNTGTSLFTAQVDSISLTTNWVQYVIPIPLPARLASEKGLYFFSAGNLAGVGFTIWVDDIKFEALPATSSTGGLTLTTTSAAFVSGAVTKSVGDSFTPGAASAVFSVSGAKVSEGLMPSYFTWTSSNTSVATVGADGTCKAVATGTASVTAALGSTPATGTLSITVR